MEGAKLPMGPEWLPWRLPVRSRWSKRPRWPLRANFQLPKGPCGHDIRSAGFGKLFKISSRQVRMEKCFFMKTWISIGKAQSNPTFWWKPDKEIITIGSFLVYRFGLGICFGGDLCRKIWKSEEKYIEKYSFGAELGLGGSVWGIRGWKMIARVLGSPWKPSRGPKRP